MAVKPQSDLKVFRFFKYQHDKNAIVLAKTFNDLSLCVWDFFPSNMR